MNRAAVILFVGDERDEAKRKRLPAPFLRVLHRYLLRRLRSAGQYELLLSRDIAEPRGSESLGEWVKRSIQRAFDLGYGTVAIAAADVPGLTSAHLSRALGAARENGGMAIGASGDGGFYVAAFASSPLIDWSAAPLQTSRAAEWLIQSLRCCGWAIEALPVLDDIDTQPDARRLALAMAQSISAQLLALLAHVWFLSPHAEPVVIRTEAHRFLRAPPPAAR